MRRSLLLLVAGFLLAALLVAGAVTRTAGADTSPAGAPPVADTVYTNGVVATEDAAHTSAQAIAVKDGKIVYVGGDAGAAAFVGAGTTSVDLGGAFVCPASSTPTRTPMVPSRTSTRSISTRCTRWPRTRRRCMPLRPVTRSWT